MRLVFGAAIHLDEKFSDFLDMLRGMDLGPGFLSRSQPKKYVLLEVQSGRRGHSD